MHLGIDFGTTRTVVAQSDRGNYPVVGFEDLDGDLHDYFPSLVAVDPEGRTSFGFEARRAAEEGATLVRSVKRHLASADLTLDSTMSVAGRELVLLDLVSGYLAALSEALVTGSTCARGEALGRVAVAVPAHAFTAQRLFTLEAFDRAGFAVSSMLNEPSAAGFEYTHRHARTVTSRRNRVLVYDLGGGTFDASLVQADGTRHEVLGSAGVNRLGGDDFDLVLADLVLAKAGVDEASLPVTALDALVEQCQQAKESLTAQTRRIPVELDGELVVVPAEDFYRACDPLVEQSLETMSSLVDSLGPETEEQVAGIHLVGGGSSLPSVPRRLRERFGRRVHRAQQPGASTAIGLAIAADPESGYSLTERLSRSFGVFREQESGARVVLDQVLSPQQEVESDGAAVTRRYRAVHDLGVLRFVECADVAQDGSPAGALAPVGELRFPFDRRLQDGRDLSGHRVGPLPDGEDVWVEEVYRVDGSGAVSVTVTDLGTGFTLEAQWG